MVHFDPEDHGAIAQDFDFAGFAVNSALQRAFAEAFAQRTRPGSSLRAVESAKKAFLRMQNFAGYLAGLLRPPASAADLTPAHVDGWYLTRSGLKNPARELNHLKADLRKMAGLSAEFRAKLSERGAEHASSARTVSYSRAEFDRILNAARTDIRRAARRIRANRELLGRWREGQVDSAQDQPEWLRGRLLDFVDRNADVPRECSGKYPLNWVAALGAVPEHVMALHLGPDEAVAFTVLLVGLTGQNRGSIVSAPAAHHRPDGYAGDIGTAIVELDKPRRGANRHMDVAFVEVPDWVPVPQDEPRDEGLDLHTPFGVYMLLHELAAASRRLANTDRLLVWWASRGGKGRGDEAKGRGLRTGLHSNLVSRWAARHNLAADADNSSDGNPEAQPTALRVTLPRLRLSRVEQRQEPIAHTPQTLANDYLLRNRGNLTEYQQIVADVLQKEVMKARTRTALQLLTADEVEEARSDPKAVAARHGMDPTTLTHVINRELDTVMAACTDNLNGLDSPPGLPCRASFMLCLGCPNARALPFHLPVQAAVHDELVAFQAEMPPLRWAERFALPHAQLADLLDRAGEAAVSDARANITDDERHLVDRFLNRELDLR